MELRHLRYFVAVAESGSITKAAQRLGIQQPPLGQQIRALEAELKVQLFERAPKRVVLSNSGREFLEDARRILASAKEAVEKVRRFDRGEQGLLTVGFTSSASMHPIAPRILGGGIPLFRQGERQQMKLLDAKPLSVGAVVLRYAPAN